MKYALIGPSERSFPASDPFRDGAVSPRDAEIIIHLGSPYAPAPEKALVLVELGTECLGDHTGEEMGQEGSNVLGFARYRNGRDAPSPLVEIVRQKNTSPASTAAARAVFENAGLKTALCTDQTGRIIDRLVRPKYNAALRFLDEGRASQPDMDLTCRLGLGYPDGPIERVIRGGLDEHYEISRILFEATGSAAYVPARRAAVAFRRRESGR
jgi:3-hydroxybutyryl-CoA dehydrogenase